MTIESAFLPIFPLQTVLFPGGVLPLRIFEARYMDMSTRCLKDESVFGVNLISEGSEVGKPAVPYSVGVTARITAWDMEQPGLLQLITVGERRYRIRRTELANNGLLMAEVEWLPQAVPIPMPDGYAALVTLLEAVIEDAGEEHFPAPHFLDNPEWVGMRLASVLPMPMLARQRLLELDDPLDRIEIIRRYLEDQGLSGR